MSSLYDRIRKDQCKCHISNPCWMFYNCKKHFSPCNNEHNQIWIQIWICHVPYTSWNWPFKAFLILKHAVKELNLELIMKQYYVLLHTSISHKIKTTCLMWYRSPLLHQNGFDLFSMNSIRSMKLCCIIWHKDFISRSFKSWGGVGAFKVCRHVHKKIILMHVCTLVGSIILLKDVITK